MSTTMGRKLGCQSCGCKDGWNPERDSEKFDGCRFEAALQRIAAMTDTWDENDDLKSFQEIAKAALSEKVSDK